MPTQPVFQPRRSDRSNIRRERRLNLRAWLAGCLSIAAVACFSGAQAQATHADAVQIVMAGGDMTEIAHALGAGERIVGVDGTSTYPETAASLPNIGYVRALAPESVLSLAPDLVLASYYAGPPSALERIEAAGVPVAKAPAPIGNAQQDVPAKLRFVGRALGREDAAETLVANFQRELMKVTHRLGDVAHRPRVLFVLSTQGGPLTVGGEGTVVADIITRAGGKPVTGGIKGYRPLSREAVMALAPDVVLTMHEGDVPDSSALASRADIAQTPAGRNNRFITMEGMLLLGFGPRTPKAIATLGRALHPERFAAADERP